MARHGRDRGRARECQERIGRGYYREVRGREKARGVVVRYSVVLCGVRGYRSHRDISSGRPDTPLPSPGTAKAAAQKPWVPYALSFGLRPSELHALEFKYSCRRERGTWGSQKGMKGGKGEGGRRGSCRRWTGFRRDWKIRSIHPSRSPTRRFVLLLFSSLRRRLPSLPSPFFS